MYQLLHLFNKSSALGLAAVEQFNLPRRGTWSRFAAEVESITFQSKGYRCDLWPQKLQKFCTPYKCYLGADGGRKEKCHSTTAVIVKKATAAPRPLVDLRAMWAADEAALNKTPDRL
jgi:hypothetical protein